MWGGCLILYSFFLFRACVASVLFHVDPAMLSILYSYTPLLLYSFFFLTPNTVLLSFCPSVPPIQTMNSTDLRTFFRDLVPDSQQGDDTVRAKKTRHRQEEG